ncbi:hypothetical protein MRX96_022890 [Rhipicephalus microplus]
MGSGGADEGGSKENQKTCSSMEYVMHNKEGKRAASILLFSDVTNCSELRQLVLSGCLQVCLIRASLVADIFQGPSGSIGDSLRQMGAQDADTTIVVVRLDDPGDCFLKTLTERIKGRQLPLDSIPQFTDTGALTKMFKVTEKELTVGTLLDAVVTRIALKNTV